MNEICLVVLIGIPGSGKTTFTQRFKTAFQNSFQFKVYCIDNLAEVGSYREIKKKTLRCVENLIVFNLFSNFNMCHSSSLLQNSHNFPILHISSPSHNSTLCNSSLLRTFSLPLLFSTAPRDLSSQIFYISQSSFKCLQINPRIKLPSVIIIDDNMALKNSRRKYYNLAQKYKISFLQIFFDVQLEEAIMRNELRSNPIPCEIVENFANIIEKPKTNSNTLFINANIEITWDILLSVKNRIEIALKNPLSKQEELLKENVTTSILQKVNFFLRRIVSIEVKKSSTEKGKELNNLKNEIFNRIKSGCIGTLTNLNDEELFDILQKFFYSNKFF